jgi:CubicO group peptidase (beta-lactamase class C family)
MSLIEEGTPGARHDRPVAARRRLAAHRGRVTIEHLLAHRSGIGDYFDEEIDRPKDAYLLPIPVHELATTEPYIRVLDGSPTKFPRGERFSYSNSGYVVLALLAERVFGVPFHHLVVQRVCQPAGMVDTDFVRSDDLPERTALGYIDPNGHRTNVLHLAVRGTGDGGIYTTAADMYTFWMLCSQGGSFAPKPSPR